MCQCDGVRISSIRSNWRIALSNSKISCCTRHGTMWSSEFSRKLKMLQFGACSDQFHSPPGPIWATIWTMEVQSSDILFGHLSALTSSFSKKANWSAGSTLFVKLTYALLALKYDYWEKRIGRSSSLVIEIRVENNCRGISESVFVVSSPEECVLVLIPQLVLPQIPRLQIQTWLRLKAIGGCVVMIAESGQNSLIGESKTCKCHHFARFRFLFVFRFSSFSPYHPAKKTKKQQW